VLWFNIKLADTELFYGYRRRESTDVEDMFIAHISGMDTMARGLRNVAKLIEVTETL
jgi:xylose isomerase